MIYKKCIFVLSLMLNLLTMAVAQQSTKEPTLATEIILGKWDLQKVYAGSREITKNPNSEIHSGIEFKQDGTYQQNGEETDNGSYRLNEDQSVLYLESVQKKETSSATTVNTLKEYNISIKDGILVMQSRGDENRGVMKYVYSKSEQ